MNYNEALEYIHSVSNFFCKPGLERISALCEMMGNPQNNLKFVHVAGTNGKGSFCSMLSSVLTEAGYNTGLYTSPYIVDFNERIAINGKMIADDELSELTAYVKGFADSMTDKPTEFELITAIAFEYFSRKKCDIVVLECGLGGRYDATNVVKNSVLSVITGISIDHTAFLGNTVAEIAGEKAGIIKKGVPCLWCGNNAEAFEVIKDNCEKQSSILYTVDHSKLDIKMCDLNKTVFDFDGLFDISISLLGTYQPINASNVISAVRLLNKSGYKISENHLRNGLVKTAWRARFELICSHPVVIADGAHNPEGIENAVLSIKKYFGEQKVNIITGVMKDKDYEYIAETLARVAGHIYCITPDNPRALSACEYRDVFSKKGVSASVCGSVSEAVFNSMCNGINQGVPTVALGSLYMYSEVVDAVKSFCKNSLNC